MSTKMERIYWIDKQIRAKRYPNARKVQERFELGSTRIVYEDRKFMINRLHAPIKYSRSRDGWYYTDATYFLPEIMLTREEITAFFLGEELFRRYLGTPFETPLRLALNKIKQHLPEHVGYDAQRGTAAFAFTGGGRAMVDPELLLELNQAILSKRSIEIEYYSASSGQTNTRTVDPYHLHNIHGDWYLIAYCHTRREPRDFLTSRIKARKSLLSTFQVAPSFSLDAYLETGFLAERATAPDNIVIKFDEYQARWIRERLWHSSQQIEELPSGGLILRLRVGGLGEVKRWVMGYGPHAEVLEPESLRREIKAEVEKMQKIYRKK